ncbi:T6SS immunity protein Tli4 family protein [Collimonas antrihumi]|uniref:T6SS immunity protein Tli4 family protein n=1 Tax=Collimonas antrihumi TaxID=1940615 RepID=UPI001B8D54B6|nr:T6SS immunity protein Tli4 family protein [Collimonas antrihumi]
MAGLLACLTLTLAACEQRNVPLSEQEKQTVTELTSNLKSQCVGRYMIDMPANVSITGSAKIQGVNFEAKAMTQEEYLYEVTAREAELKATRHQDGYQFLFANGPAWGPGTRYFIHLKDTYSGNISRIIEGYKWDKGYRIHLKIKASDVTTSTYKDDPTSQVIGNNVPQKTRLIFELLDTVRGRADDDVPTEPGVCFLGGFWPGKAGDNEEIGNQFALLGNQDVAFGLNTSTNSHDTSTLLQRGDQIADALKTTPGGRTVSKGVVELQDMKAEEWLLAGTTPLRTLGNVFTLEANSRASSELEPFVELKMRTAWPNHLIQEYSLEKASLNNSEALALWDVVSRTLRPRPNGF